MATTSPHAALLALIDEPPDRCERRIARAKRKEFPRRNPEDWSKHGYARSDIISHLRTTIRDMVPRVDAAETTPEQFIERFERPALPAVVAGLDRGWAAHERWTLDALLREYGDERFKVGEDDEGYAVYVKLKYYVRYLLLNDDDSPLYVFDSSFADREGTRALRRDYALPAYFTDDLFKLVGERRRPPYRWWVLGPERSGSYIHIDPLGTSAWNALLTGHKCWALFPPATPKEVVAPKHAGGREAISWWRHVYPTLVNAADPAHRPMTVIQRPGETVFVPGGWWHVVLNLDVAMAVTQNFCSPTNFDTVWLRTNKSRPKMALKWQEELRTAFPALHQRTLDLHESGKQLDFSSSSSSSSVGPLSRPPPPIM